MSVETPAVHVVDDDAGFRTALVRLLTAWGHQALAYSSAEDFLARGAQGRGCVVTDLRMPRVDGLALQEACAHSTNAMPFVFLSGNCDVPSAVTALKHGAIDFVEKCAPREVLLAAINGALQRDLVASRARERREHLRSRFALLTDREQQVLALVVRGRMNKQIAADLGIHERTVKLHRTAVTSKLRVRSAAEMTALVLETKEAPESAAAVV